MLQLPRSPQRLLRRTVSPDERWAAANKSVTKQMLTACTNVRVPLELRPATHRNDIDAAWLPEVEQFVAKSLVSARGEGVAIVQRQRETWRLGTRSGLTRGAVAQSLRQLGAYIMAEEYIQSHSILRELCPIGELVDLRLMFLHGAFFVGRLRVPTRRSLGYGNVAKGAFGVCLDEGGRVTASHPYAKIATGVHPDTGRNLDGYAVPEWSPALQQAKSIARLFRSPQVSVDGTIDASGRLVVLEITLIPSTAWLSIEGSQAFCRGIRRPIAWGAKPEAQDGLRRWLEETPLARRLIEQCRPSRPNAMTVRLQPTSGWWHR